MANTPDFIDGAETGDLSAVASSSSGSGGSVSVVAALDSIGQYCYKAALDPTQSSSSGYITFALPSASAFRGVRVYALFAALPTAGTHDVMGAYNGSNQICWSLAINSTGNLLLYDATNTLQATSAATLSPGANNQIGISVNTTTGAYVLQINGNTDQSGTASGFTGNGAAATVWFGRGVNLTNNYSGLGAYTACYFDDMNFDTGAMPAAGQVVLMQPAAAGTYSAWAVTGTIPSAVQWPSDGDTSYINDGTPGDASSFTLTNTSLTLSAINCAMIGAFIAGASGSVKLRCRSGTTNNDSSAKSTVNGYAYYASLLATDPNTSAAWTGTGLNAAEVGLVNNALIAIRCTAIGMMVDMLPAVPPSFMLCGVGS